MLRLVSFAGSSVLVLSAVVLACTSSSEGSPPGTSVSGEQDASIAEGDDGGSAAEAGSCLKRKEGPGRAVAAACTSRTRDSWDAIDAGVRGDGGSTNAQATPSAPKGPTADAARGMG